MLAGITFTMFTILVKYVSMLTLANYHEHKGESNGNVLGYLVINILDKFKLWPDDASI